MAFYSVTYDLNKTKDYEKFKEGIIHVSSNRFIKATLSQYIIQSHFTAGQIRDFLKAYADSDDSILVLRLNVSEWAYTNLPDSVGNWLNKATAIGN